MKNLLQTLATVSLFCLFTAYPMHRQLEENSYAFRLAKFHLDEAKIRQTSECPLILRCHILDATYHLENGTPHKEEYEARRNLFIAQLAKLDYSPNFFCYDALYDNQIGNALNQQRINLQSKQIRARRMLAQLRAQTAQQKNMQRKGTLTQEIIRQRLTCLALRSAHNIVALRAKRQAIFASPEYQQLKRDFECEINDNSALEQRSLKKDAVIMRLHEQILALKQKRERPKKVDQSTQTN